MLLGGVAQAFICAAGSGDEAFLFQRDGADGFDLCVDSGGRVARFEKRYGKRKTGADKTAADN